MRYMGSGPQPNGVRVAAWLLGTVGLLLIQGCAYGVGEQTDQMVCDLAARVRDPEPLRDKDATPAPMQPANWQSGPIPNEEKNPLERVVFLQKDPANPPPTKKLE